MVSYFLAVVVVVVVRWGQLFPGKRSVARAWSQAERNPFPSMFHIELFLVAQKTLPEASFELSLWVFFVDGGID